MAVTGILEQGYYVCMCMTLPEIYLCNKVLLRLSVAARGPYALTGTGSFKRITFGERSA
ncbi:hypothetical protein KSZ_61350 [Dictyobacter formicarum]|uniref:Uncharacterized protein n=1 Tax=Dictyobacter formicarum TaxID=2778368 RepID=A0ABQ3VQY9_9CHLR|nr:hypothetical protein KSZ_61350 [Dictyobacter formicarum]